MCVCGWVCLSGCEKRDVTIAARGGVMAKGRPRQSRGQTQKDNVDTNIINPGEKRNHPASDHTRTQRTITQQIIRGKKGIPSKKLFWFFVSLYKNKKMKMMEKTTKEGDKKKRCTIFFVFVFFFLFAGRDELKGV